MTRIAVDASRAIKTPPLPSEEKYVSCRGKRTGPVRSCPAFDRVPCVAFGLPRVSASWQSAFFNLTVIAMPYAAAHGYRDVVEPVLPTGQRRVFVDPHVCLRDAQARSVDMLVQQSMSLYVRLAREHGAMQVDAVPAETEARP